MRKELTTVVRPVVALKFMHAAVPSSCRPTHIHAADRVAMPSQPTSTDTNTEQDPGVHSAFQELLRRHPDVDAILLSTNDGVPLLRGTPTRADAQAQCCLACAVYTHT